MIPVTAVAPVDSVLQAASKVVSSPALDELGQKFDSMMKPSVGSHPVLSSFTEPLPPIEGVTSMTNAMSIQGQEWRDVTADVHDLTANVSHMSMTEMMAHSMEISHRMTLLSAKMTATTSVANNSNKSLQSLLKNQ